MSEKATFKVINFGCPVNQYEACAMESAMQKAGFEKISEKADIYIVNSCVVTASAAAGARRTVRGAKRENPEALTVLAGCYPQVYYREIEKQLSEADLIIGTTGRAMLPGLIRDKLAGRLNQKIMVKEHDGKEVFEDMPLEYGYNRIRPVVKVQEGCNEYCTYCIIAWARGKPRSLSPQRVIEQAVYLVKLGYKEIILAGNHLGIYGRDIPGWDLVKLLKELDNISGKFRIRLNYLEPMDVQDKLFETAASSSKICPHFYLPMQSGSDLILKKMGRKYTSDDYRNLVRKARAMSPDVSVFSDIITGFPGEKESDHQKTMEIIEDLQLSKIHAFSYSPRPGTPAEKFTDNVRPDVKKRRVKELRSKDKELESNFKSRMVGKILFVLPERQIEDEGCVYSEGLSANNVRVRILTDGVKEDIIKVKAVKAYEWGVLGEQVL
ncbi:MAG: tRNA (N(6)-L-threonylcarbamoyladenosine(37)-C(2))-methylthiotransferase MtaB [Clostridiales bacterium]|nr:tRNA (N(6)-L-threonylcarbamoyladenosine(37)-C(2))-methylthiotransferase MtaB [Clostridiales bacterium]MCF8021891.1 tRNA (N(6)-L-threonylcarbamoyladenosine(37)-C(2))-methylthiotransferase MtaB [Clostridiales bacterium]